MMLHQVKVAKVGAIVMSSLICALGIALIILPTIPSWKLCFLLGLLFLGSGVVRVIGYFSGDLYNLAFQFDLALGFSCIALGALLLVRGESLEAYLSPLFGLMILNDALSKVQTCIDAKRFGLVSLWWRLMLLSIATGVLGALLLITPFASRSDMATLMGVAALAEGTLNLLSIVFLVKTQTKGNLT